MPTSSLQQCGNAMLELESVHIPKTAGTSFVKVLLAWYGKCLALRYHNTGSLSKVQPWTLAIHGHFPVGSVDAQLHITWVREPAERIASQFYYWLAEPPANPNDLLHAEVHAGGVSLLEFAGRDEMRNSMSKYLGDDGLDGLDFVGIVERYDEELLRLARIVGRDPIVSSRANETRSEAYAQMQADPEWGDVLASIRAANADDVALYAAAVDRATTAAITS
jgi:hypothetical protein